MDGVGRVGSGSWAGLMIYTFILDFCWMGLDRTYTTMREKLDSYGYIYG